MKLLTPFSEHPAAEHEPFNHEARDIRQFGHVYKEWVNTRNVDPLRKLCRSHFLIKHVYDKFDDAFNSSLALAAYNAGYRQIHLLRRDKVARLASKGIANAEGTWYPGAHWPQATAAHPPPRGGGRAHPDPGIRSDE
jgi:hypothetical protein